jgi:hypothetical protein
VVDYTEIKLVWKYSPPCPDAPEWREEWILYAGDKDIAKFTKYRQAFMERHGLCSPMFVCRSGYEDFLPWSVIREQLDYGNELFEFSKAGRTSIDFDDICDRTETVMATRQPDGSFRIEND